MLKKEKSKIVNNALVFVNIKQNVINILAKLKIILISKKNFQDAVC